MALPDLSALVVDGREITIKVTPNARRENLELGEAGGPIRVAVTVVPEDGKATEAARALLAKALGVAKSRLTLVRGVKSREKVFRIDV